MHTHQSAIYDNSQKNKLLQKRDSLFANADAKDQHHKCLTETSQTRHSAQLDLAGGKPTSPGRDGEEAKQNGNVANLSPDGEIIPDINDVDEAEAQGESEEQREKRKLAFKMLARRSQSLIIRLKKDRLKKCMIYPEDRFHKFWDTIITL